MRTDLGRWVTSSFFSPENEGKKRMTWELLARTHRHLSFLSIIKRQIKILSSSAAISSISLFSLILRKNLIQTSKPYCISTVFSIRWAKNVVLHICHRKGIVFYLSSHRDNKNSLPSESISISENINIYVLKKPLQISTRKNSGLVSGQDRKRPPAHETNQILGFGEFRRLTNLEKNNSFYF